MAIPNGNQYNPYGNTTYGQTQRPYNNMDTGSMNQGNMRDIGNSQAINQTSMTGDYSSQFAQYGRGPQEQPQPVYPPMNDAYFQARMVRNENDIMPKEIPMDGSFRIFITADMSTVYAKTWGSNGLPQTIEYRAVPKEQQNSSESAMTTILARLAQIEAKIDHQNQAATYRPQKRKYNKPSNQQQEVPKVEGEVVNNG